MAQTYEPKPLDFTPATLEPIALMLLATSFFIGLKRIEATFIATNHNFQALSCAETAGRMSTAINEGVTHGFDPGTGLEFSREDLYRQRDKNKLFSKFSEEAFEKATKLGEKYYNWRNRLLYAGFGALLLGKFVSPYFDTASNQELPTTPRITQEAKPTPATKAPQSKK